MTTKMELYEQLLNEINSIRDNQTKFEKAKKRREKRDSIEPNTTNKYYTVYYYDSFLDIEFTYHYYTKQVSINKARSLYVKTKLKNRLDRDSIIITKTLNHEDTISIESKYCLYNG